MLAGEHTVGLQEELQHSTPDEEKPPEDTNARLQMCTGMQGVHRIAAMYMRTC